MLTLVGALVVLLVVSQIDAGNVKLSSTVDERRRFTCPGELVTFTCQVFGSISLEWQSPPNILIAYTTAKTPPDTIAQGPFEANLTSVSKGDIAANSNITSTMRMTEPLDVVSVKCLSTQDNETETFTETDIPDTPQDLSVEFDGLPDSLIVTITWQPPGNTEHFDLDEYTVNITSTSGIDNSTQVPAGTTMLQLTDDRTQRSTARFTVKVAAMDMCGQTGIAASKTINVPHCSPMELWDLPAAGFNLLSDVSLLGDEATKYPSCDAKSVGSVVLKDTTLNTATVAYYTGNMTGSTACFVCDQESGYTPNTSTNERDCQIDETWSKSSSICVCKLTNLPTLNLALLVVGIVSGLLLAIVFTIILYVIAVCYSKMIPENKCFTYTFLGFAGVFCAVAVVLWIVVGGVTPSPSNGNPCDPSWRFSRDGLTYSGLVFSIVPFILLFIALFIQFLLWKFAPSKWAQPWQSQIDESDLSSETTESAMKDGQASPEVEEPKRQKRGQGRNINMNPRTK